MAITQEGGGNTQQDTNCIVHENYSSTCRTLLEKQRWTRWIPTHGRAKAGRPARIHSAAKIQVVVLKTYLGRYREEFRDIRAASTIWWWWWYISWNNIDIFYLHIFVYVLSSCRIDFMASGGYKLMNLLKVIVT